MQNFPPDQSDDKTRKNKEKKKVEEAQKLWETGEESNKKVFCFLRKMSTLPRLLEEVLIKVRS